MATRGARRRVLSDGGILAAVATNVVRKTPKGKKHELARKLFSPPKTLIVSKEFDGGGHANFDSDDDDKNGDTSVLDSPQSSASSTGSEKNNDYSSLSGSSGSDETTSDESRDDESSDGDDPDGDDPDGDDPDGDEELIESDEDDDSASLESIEEEDLSLGSVVIEDELEMPWAAREKKAAAEPAIEGDEHQPMLPGGEEDYDPDGDTVLEEDLVADSDDETLEEENRDAEYEISKNYFLNIDSPGENEKTLHENKRTEIVAALVVMDDNDIDYAEVEALSSDDDDESISVVESSEDGSERKRSCLENAPVEEVSILRNGSACTSPMINPSTAKDPNHSSHLGSSENILTKSTASNRKELLHTSPARSSSKMVNQVFDNPIKLDLISKETSGGDITELESEKPNIPNKKTTAESRRTPVKSELHQRTRKVVRRDGGVTHGKWVLGTKIGSGAFGAVYVGMDSITGRLMAIKTIRMDQAVMKDVKREIKVLKPLVHVNIVRYFGAEIKGGFLHIFQEWVPGGSITKMLSKFGSFPIPVIQSYLSQVLYGLEYLHENDIMHRDIKGSNILVNDKGQVKLADFGASRRFAELQGDMMMSLTARGTPYFMAPEVYDEKYSTKADIWSVGCVAVQMATGSPPWKSVGASNPVALFRHIQKSDGPPLLTGPVSDALSPFLKKCFHRNPLQRPNATDLLKDIFFVSGFVVEEDVVESKGLFSPTSCCSSEFMSPQRTGLLASPLPPLSHGRRKSFSGMVSPLLSPPLLKEVRIKMNASPSPKMDTSEWPAWAREKSELPESEINLENHVAVDKLVDMTENLSLSVGTNIENRRVSVADSLVYSIDTSRRSSGATSMTSASTLLGMQFLSTKMNE